MSNRNGTSRDQSQPDLTWLVVLLFALLWVGFVHSRAYSTNESSRLASIESLVHRGTWAIDDSPFSHTLDKIRVGDQFYSTKPPTLSFLGAGVYLALHRSLGQTLEWRECIPDRVASHCRAILEPEEANWPYVILVLLLISLPTTLTMATIYRAGYNSGLRNWANLALVIIFGLGTALFPYSTVLSNHPVSAAGLVVATYILLLHPEPKKWQLALAGFAATFAATVDLSATVFLLGLFAFVLVAHRRQGVYFLFGGLAPGLLAIALNLTITGTPLPPQLYTQGYDYPGSAFLTNPGGHRVSKDLLDYSFHLLVGERGLISFFPITLWLVYALIKTAGSEDKNRRRMAITVGLSAIGYFLYFALRTHSFGGFGFGTRWLLNPIPVFALFAMHPSVYRPRPLLKAIVVGLLGVISIAGTYRGALNPWGPAHPLIRLTYEIPEAREFIAVAISGHDSYRDVDPELRASFGANTVIRRWFDATSGFVVPSGNSWWFIDERTPIDYDLAEPFGLELKTTVALNADLTDEAEIWLKSFETIAYQSEALSPSAPSEISEVALPVSYEQDGDRLTLLGYRLNQEQGELTLITAWQANERSYPTGERRIFLHLIAPDGTLTAQDDRFSARYDGLFPGDLFFQSQTLSLGEIAPDNYWLQIGLYDPDTGVRLTTAGADRLLLRRIVVSDEDDSQK